MAGKNGKRNPKIPPGDQRRLQQDLQKSKLGRSMLEHWLVTGTCVLYAAWKPRQRIALESWSPDMISAIQTVLLHNKHLGWISTNILPTQSRVTHVNFMIFTIVLGLQFKELIIASWLHFTYMRLFSVDYWPTWLASLRAGRCRYSHKSWQMLGTVSQRDWHPLVFWTGARN